MGIREFGAGLNRSLGSLTPQQRASLLRSGAALTKNRGAAIGFSEQAKEIMVADQRDKQRKFRQSLEDKAEMARNDRFRQTYDLQSRRIGLTEEANRIERETQESIMRTQKEASQRLMSGNKPGAVSSLLGNPYTFNKGWKVFESLDPGQDKSPWVNFESPKDGKVISAKRDSDQASALAGAGWTVVSKTQTEDVTGLTRSQQGEQQILVQEYDTYINSLNDMISQIDKDPTLAGALGSVRKAGQTTTGVLSDVASAGADLAENIPVVGSVIEAGLNLIKDDEGLDQETKEEFFDSPQISKMRLFENTLAYALARSRQPKGRLLADAIKTARQDAKITGLVSSGDVINKLGGIRDTLVAQRNDAAALSGAAPASNSFGPKRITSQAEYDALNSGDTYISPDDGQMYRKP